MTDTDSRVPGTAGYARSANVLVDQYESIAFDDLYRPLIDLLPQQGQVLDIGAGTGRDAAALAARGLQVRAVEPTLELRTHGQRLHPHPNIVWTDDSLPELTHVHATGERFQLILMTAVWMHLDEAERGQALPRVAGLLAPGGRLFMTIRKGPVPPGRRMFEVPIDPLVANAKGDGLALLRRYEFADMLGRDDVSWTMLAFERANRV